MNQKSVVLLFIFFILMFLQNSISTFAQSNTDSISKVDTATVKKFVYAPVIYYQPETRWAFGAGAVYYFKPAAKKTNIQDTILLETNASELYCLGVYTLEKQFKIEFGGEIYSQQNSYFLSYDLAYYNFPNSFFGIGNNTIEENEERYTNKHPIIKINLQRKLFPNFYAGLKTFFEHTTISNIDSGGIFDTQDIAGEQGGFNTGAGPWISYDSRDNIFAPTKGVYFDASTVIHHEAIGSNYNYTDHQAELSYFLNTYKKQVVGFNLFGNFNLGNVPFNQMAELGGASRMRGNYEGRFRDKYYLTFQTEYRIPIWKYFGLAVFGGTGEVAHTINAFSLKELKYSYGGGLRLNIIPGATYNLRIDYGFGSDGDRGLYIQFNEAF